MAVSVLLISVALLGPLQAAEGKESIAVESRACSACITSTLSYIERKQGVLFH